MPGKVIMSSTYGINVESGEDKYIVIAEKFNILIAKWGLPESALLATSRRGSQVQNLRGLQIIWGNYRDE